jgi:DNA replication protein DnaC
MLHEQTYHQLIEMKMYGFAASFQEYLDGEHGEHEGSQLSFADRFGLMADREWTERQDRRLKRRLSLAKLREPACVEDIDYRHPRGLDRSVVERLILCRWLEHHENLVITGPTGIGKTWLACAFAHQACRQGYSVLYKRLPRLLHDLQMARGEGTYGKELVKIARAQLLVIDDWGLAPLADRERRDMLEILEDRHGRHSTVLASQLKVKLWHDTIGDPTIADALMDRLIHNAHKLELDGESMRKKRGLRSQKDD